MSAILKRQQIAATAVNAASQLLQAAQIMQECQAELTAMGGDGNFDDSDFINTNNPYLSAYNAGVLISVVAPNMMTAINGFVSGNSGPSNATIIRLCLPTPSLPV